MEKNTQKTASEILSLIALFALTALVCIFLYNYDNKYTAPGPQAQNGLLVLDERALLNNPVLFLVEGWAYYDGQLLSPADFAEAGPEPAAYIFIGQYGGFDAGDITASPHGCATYRLSIEVPAQRAHYLLELPEIFSAYRAYVNGELVQTMGDPDLAHYRPRTGSRTVKINASGRIDILIAAADYSHLYSGLTYPPAFGEPEAVNRLLTVRLLFRSLLTAFAFAVGVLALLVGAARKKYMPAMLYGLLCLCFVGFTSYPLVQAVTQSLYPFYMIENVSFCAMLTVVMLLVGRIGGGKTGPALLAAGFGTLMCLFSAGLHVTLPGGSLMLLRVYSALVTAAQWLAAAYLTVCAVRAVLAGRVHSMTLAGGIVMFDASLVMDRLLPMYEPVAGGWFTELFSFALILCIGVVLAGEIAAQYRDSAVLYERMSSMERLAGIQRAHYGLLMERVAETKAVKHDLRHHFVMMEAFLHDKNYEKLHAYVREFHDKVAHIQPAGYAKNPVVDILARHYARLAENSGIALSLHLDVDENTAVSEADLCALLSNLLENAVEACERQHEGPRYINVTIRQKPSMLSIRIENSTDGNVSRRGGVFLSSKAAGRKGYGLESAAAIARRYHGEAEFTYDHEKRVFVSMAVLFTHAAEADPTV